MPESKPTEALTMVIDRVRVPVDPWIDIFQLKLLSATGGSWSFVTGSPADLGFIIEGIQAGVGMMGGHLPKPEIPMQPTMTLSQAIGGMSGLVGDTIDRVLDRGVARLVDSNNGMGRS
jgi:hypothetical protein